MYNEATVQGAGVAMAASGVPVLPIVWFALVTYPGHIPRSLSMHEHVIVMGSGIGMPNATKIGR